MSNESNVKSVCVNSQSQSLVEHRLKMYGEMRFSEIVEELSESLGIEDFENNDRFIAEQLVKVMAEVLCLPDDAPVRIEKILRSARDVKEIYVQLEQSHIWEAVNNFKKIDYQIKHLKAYYKVQIYNSFFEV